MHTYILLSLKQHMINLEFIFILQIAHIMIKSNISLASFLPCTKILIESWLVPKGVNTIFHHPLFDTWIYAHSKSKKISIEVGNQKITIFLPWKTPNQGVKDIHPPY